MATGGEVVGGVRILLVTIFGLALAEGVRTIRSGTSEWHPVILVSAWRRRKASLLIELSLLANGVTAALLIHWPPWGGEVASLLVVAYSIAAWKIHYESSADCKCFWLVMNAESRLGLLWRNGLLLVMAVTVATRGGVMDVRALPWAVIFFGALIATTRLMDRVARRPVPVGLKER
ncbi:MAG: hypothetical protein M3P12_13705 [Gemmatimonadota bacterium]|nr:hypothetical protein [Gemmatimonadota bacterium]